MADNTTQRWVPVHPSGGRLRPLGLGEVRLTGGFWGARQRLNADIVIPHCHAWMSELGWIDNFRLAAHGGLPAGRQGREFSDSEVYKMMEALAWDIGRGGATRSDELFTELVAIVAAAQEADGYLNTRFGHQGPQSRYTDLEWGHELYCYGHLIQAGVARMRTHGDDEFVNVARRAADHVCRTFGALAASPDSSPHAGAHRAGVGGHPQIEMSLIELYRATGADRYLEQARLLVERRGHHVLGDIALGRAYFQDDVPVRDARRLRGHTVRALYLACGAVDVAVETDDRELLAAVIEQWRNTVAARTYVTGGMGSRHTDEAFGSDFELPPDRAYSETCAAIASVMLAWRLLLVTGDARYADHAERALYNVVATSPAQDGRSFFYTNTLHQRDPGAVSDPDVASPHAAGGLRSPWFTVSCCPTNVARMLASLAGYIATVDDHGLQLHQLNDVHVRTELAGRRRVALRMRTDYPWSGVVTVRVEETDGESWRLAVRIPAWADRGAVLTVGDQHWPVGSGYAVTERAWRPGDEIRLDLPMHARWTRPDPRIDAVRGSVAAERGPLVYCAESVDQDPSVRLPEVEADTSTPPRAQEAATGIGIPLTCTARHLRPTRRDWPYRDVAEDAGGEASLVQPPERVTLTLVPYHCWGNRGPATMRVWLPEHPSG